MSIRALGNVMSKQKRHVHDSRARRDQFMDSSGRARPALSWNAVLFLAVVAFLGVAMLTMVLGSRAASGPSATHRRVETLLTGRDLSIPVEAYADGRARFYKYAAPGGRNVSFFVMKSSDGVIRAALDACIVCYRERKGYHQEGDAMVCNNCGQSFRSADINVITGGCNPIPIDRTVDGSRVLLSASALERGVAYF